MDKLPREIWMRVVYYLRDVDLVTLGRTCRCFEAISLDEHLWKDFYDRLVDMKSPFKANAHYKQLYELEKLYQRSVQLVEQYATIRNTLEASKKISKQDH